MLVCLRCGKRHYKPKTECECGEVCSIISVPDHEANKLKGAQRIKSAACLVKEKTDYEEFPGFEFLGDLAKSYKMNVYGPPGSGKSTFCLIFAQSYAARYGRVLYVSGEERHSESFRKKLLEWEVDSDRLLITESSTKQDILHDITDCRPRCVVIDSVTALRLETKDIKVFHEKISGPIIAIQHVTKDGMYKGGTEIAHDTDIVCEVKNGIAVTTKNRFGPKGRAYPIFTRGEEISQDYEECYREMQERLNNNSDNDELAETYER